MIDMDDRISFYLLPSSLFVVHYKIIKGDDAANGDEEMRRCSVCSVFFFHSSEQTWSKRSQQKHNDWLIDWLIDDSVIAVVSHWHPILYFYFTFAVLLTKNKKIIPTTNNNNNNNNNKIDWTSQSQYQSQSQSKSQYFYVYTYILLLLLIDWSVETLVFFDSSSRWIEETIL
jgi:hypothetical protein